MWLLDAKTRRLEYFVDEDKIPPYAILSHTWAEEEISFQDLINTAVSPKDITEKLGWAKVEGACRLALENTCGYIWIDTCCIDKSSSAELQEAINSMFTWYECAKLCFAYLGDVSADDKPAAEGSAFRRCRWFTRGWTLQELLAPHSVIFFDKSWVKIASRSDLRQLISDITGIEKFYLDHPAQGAGAYSWLSRASIAERMSWAANRETTRKEDTAYCLLGIFDINMPLLYGEGTKAFRRLQEEIMRATDDSSLLCWGYQEPCSNWRTSPGAFILAPHPAYFKQCRGIVPLAVDGFSMPSFSMNQRGLQVNLPVRTDLTHPEVVYGILGCGPRMPWEVKRDDGEMRFVAIPLVSTSTCDELRTSSKPQKDEYLRHHWCRPTLVSTEFLKQATPRVLTIRRASENRDYLQQLPFGLGLAPFPTTAFDVVGTYPPQPVGGQFASLSKYPAPFMDPWRGMQRTNRLLDDERPRRSEKGQRMLHIKVSEGYFLVLLEYEVTTIKGWGQHQLGCRVFNLPGPFSLEFLHRLTITQDFTQLRELCCKGQGDSRKFRINDDSRILLDIIFRKTEEPAPITDVFIYVVDQQRTRDGINEDKFMSWLDKMKVEALIRPMSRARRGTSSRGGISGGEPKDKT